MSLYSILNRHAKAWWYHQQLRDRAQVQEARRLERASIRNYLRDLRKMRTCPGAYFSLGRGGCSMNGQDWRCEGYDQDFFKALALATGLPLIDTLTIPDDQIVASIRIPMVAVGREPDAAPYGGFSYAPLDVVAGLYQSLGATIYNLEPAQVTLDSLRKPQPVPKSEPVRLPVIEGDGGVTVDLQAVLDEGMDGACLACGEYADGIEPDATDYHCPYCGANRVWGAEQLFLTHA